MTIPIPSPTPNVVVSNPFVRKIVGIVLGTAALILPVAGIIDMYSDAIDWSFWTVPAGAIVLFLGGAFGLGVTVPNVPVAKPDQNVAILAVPSQEPQPND